MKSKNTLYKLSGLFGCLCSFFSETSIAHVISNTSAAPSALTWQNGLVHPLTGLDHFLTMFGIGLLSYYISNHNFNKSQHYEKINKNNSFHYSTRELIKLPLVFCSFLLASFLLQIGDIINLSYLTPAILIIALGFLIFRANIKYLVWLLLPLISFVHGHIHSSDVFSISLNFPYIISFVFTTFILHIFGIKLAELCNRLYKSSNKLVGLVFMLLGLYLAV